MAGLMQAAGAPAAPETAAPPQPEAPAAEQQENGQMASPEEQKLYDEIVTRAYTLIFDEKSQQVRPEILQGLQGDDPKSALADVASMVFARVMQAAQQGGVQIPGDVKEAAGKEVFETLAEVATQAGIYDFMGDDKAFEAAFLLAADQLRQIETQNGTLDQEATKADFADMVQMDKDGRLAQIMQGLGAAGGA